MNIEPGNSGERIVNPDLTNDDSGIEHALRPKTLKDFIGQQNLQGAKSIFYL